MKIYHFDRNTSEFVGEGVANESPLEPGVFLVPAFATYLEPPATGQNEAAVFENGAWTVKADHRGTYYDAQRQAVAVTEIGQDIPAGCTTEPAPPALDEVKKQKVAAIMAAFAARSRGPVDIGGMKFDGGWSSLDKLDRAIQFADKIGITERTWYETDETPHVLPVHGQAPSGEAILLAVALEYDRLDGMMRAMIRAARDAETIEDVEAITISWDNEA